MSPDRPYNPASLAENRISIVPMEDVAAAEAKLSSEREALMDRAALAGVDSMLPAPLKDAGVSLSEPGAIKALGQWASLKMQQVPWWVLLGGGLLGGGYLMHRKMGK